MLQELMSTQIISEATTNMDAFENERKFAAWAGVASGNNESGGKKKDQKLEKATHTCEKL